RSYLFLTHYCCFFFSSRRRHTRSKRDWSSDVCSSDLPVRTCKAFVERLKAAGRDVELTEYPDSPHGFDIGLLGANLLAISPKARSEEHTSELQSRFDLVCRLLLENNKQTRLESSYANT